MSETIETRTEAIPFGASAINKHTIALPFGGEKTLTLETGHIARQAHGTVLARVGNTVVMANVVRSAKPLENADFFPLTVDYREKHYAVGRIPGNFFRREGRPSTAETINARLIDRTIRPLFPKGFSYDVQVYLTVLAMDQINPPSVVAINAATAALAISDIPITGVAAGARIGRVDGNLVVNPTFEERENGTLDLVVGGTKAAVTMVECGSKFLSEEQMLEALQLGHESVQQLVAGF
jgi:polyribonucleotide nucleotidyltransferase